MIVCVYVQIVKCVLLFFKQFRARRSPAADKFSLRFPARHTTIGSILHFCAEGGDDMLRVDAIKTAPDATRETLRKKAAAGRLSVSYCCITSSKCWSAFFASRESFVGTSTTSVT